MFRKTKKIPFYEIKDLEAPVVKVRMINGPDGYAVIDTGSEMTVFDKQFVMEHESFFDFKEINSKITTIDMSGETEARPLVSVSTDIAFSSSEYFSCIVYKLKGMVADLGHIRDHMLEKTGDKRAFVAIIGCDFLRKSRASVDMHNNLLKIRV